MDYLGDLSVATLKNDRRTLLAVSRAAEIVGEAAHQVHADVRRALPTIDFSDAISMRHHLVHGYGSVDVIVLRDTVRDDFPTLIAALDEVLAMPLPDD